VQRENRSDGAGLGYLPALDGIRALSLIAILLYHAGFGWARGGYLGVTVFFTLSGFLITGLLLRERDVIGRIDLRGFWGRRARRLVPAVLGLFALVLVLLAAGALTGSRSMVGDAVATGGWVANWRFIFAGQTYAGLFGNPSPFQHMWSLAVEEQFYLLLPMTVLLTLGRNGRVRRGRLVGVVVAAVAASVVLCAWLYHPTSTTRSYFGTDTRMAEPLIGVLLALALVGGRGIRQLAPTARRILDAQALLALGALVLLMHRLGEYDARLYRGGFLLTAILAGTVIAASTQPGTLIGRALAAAPLRSIGRVSYGGYVYHWPVFIWLSAERTGLAAWPLFALRTGVTLVLATASYKLLEVPIRAGRLRPRLAAMAWGPASLALILGMSMIGQSSPVGTAALTGGGDAVTSAAPPLPVAPTHAALPHTRAGARPSAAAATAAAAAAAHRAARTRSTPGAGGASSDPMYGYGGNVKAPAAPPSTNTQASGPPPLRIAVVGDSMANNLGNALVSWQKSRNDVEVYNLAIPGCPISRGGTEEFPDGYQWDVKAACGWWADPQSDRSVNLKKFDPDVIVLQDSGNEIPNRKQPNWPTYLHAGDAVFDSWMLNEYQTAINTLTSGGHAKVVMLTAICGDWTNYPHWGNDATPNQRVRDVNVDYNELTATKYSLQDLNAVLCPNGKYSTTVEGVDNARPDGYHLSDTAALAVVTKWLGPILMNAGSS
jgi:peptidoglycan/LPS O-acetylase OafA/YrhL